MLKYANHEYSSFDECQARHLLLFQYIFEAVSEELHNLCISSPTHAGVANIWRNHMNQNENRANIYGRAVAKCNLVCPLHLRFPLLHLLFRQNQAQIVSEESDLLGKAEAQLRKLLDHI
jgi:hypothetical protein